VLSRNTGLAEQLFRDAFERLKRDNPEVMAKGTPVTQANVAREARRNPCSLVKTRYPELIRDIQRWSEAVGSLPLSAQQQPVMKSGRRNLELVMIERDLALSMLAEADARALQLSRELDRLQAMNQVGHGGMVRQLVA
jgi:hypothetical protein